LAESERSEVLVADIRRVKLNWSGTAVVGQAGTNFYFTAEAGTDQDCVDSVGLFMTELDAQLSGDLSWATEAGVEHFDVATGQISSIGGTTPITGTGSGSGQRLPYATQALVRWRTGAFLNGREVRGRIFLPGQLEVNNDLGVPVQGLKDAIQNAVGAILGDESTVLLVWTPTNGTAAAVTSGGPWDQWAVLRSRRD
jgi:hypothetical protein